MKRQIIACLSILLTLSIETLVQGDSTKQVGCSLIDKKHQSQYVTFERTEEIAAPSKGKGRQRVVLRLRNNTNCDITLEALGRKPTRIEIIKLPDGRNKITYTNEL